MTRYVFFAFAALSCSDPMRTRALDELGGEAPGVAEGPLHRPGQPCLVCHGDDGPAEGRFSFAGTVYRRPESLEPLGGARVRLIDATGAQYEAFSNCSGNFYVGAENFRPTWPVWTKLEWNGLSQEMASPSAREGSCAACHSDPASPSSVGHLYVGDARTRFPGGGCP